MNSTPANDVAMPASWIGRSVSPNMIATVARMNTGPSEFSTDTFTADVYCSPTYCSALNTAPPDSPSTIITFQC